MDLSVFTQKYVICTNLHSIHRHGSKIFGIVFVPAQSMEGVVLWVLIDYGGVLKYGLKYFYAEICNMYKPP